MANYLQEIKKKFFTKSLVADDLSLENVFVNCYKLSHLLAYLALFFQFEGLMHYPCLTQTLPRFPPFMNHDHLWQLSNWTDRPVCKSTEVFDKILNDNRSSPDYNYNIFLWFYCTQSLSSAFLTVWENVFYKQRVMYPMFQGLNGVMTFTVYC